MPATAQRPYHHGDLKAALLDAAEAMLERDGVQALTLRAAARAVGVSHAAPRNHFDDLTGLLSELAAVGFLRFDAALSAAMDAAGPDPRDRIRAMGRAYVGFARAHPGMFTLMFRSERLDVARPTLRAAITAARDTLRGAASASAKPTASPLQGMARATALWSLVHGFATLLLDGRLDGAMAGAGADPDRLLEAVLDAVQASA